MTKNEDAPMIDVSQSMTWYDNDNDDDDGITKTARKENDVLGGQRRSDMPCNLIRRGNVLRACFNHDLYAGIPLTKIERGEEDLNGTDRDRRTR